MQIIKAILLMAGTIVISVMVMSRFDFSFGKFFEAVASVTGTVNAPPFIGFHDNTLLTSGTAEEVIGRQGLRTWIATGGDLSALEAQLRDVPAVEQVAPFGATLHISGPAGEALDGAIAQYAAQGQWHFERAPASLEDVFIHLMSDAANANERREAR